MSVILDLDKASKSRPVKQKRVFHTSDLRFAAISLGHWFNVEVVVLVELLEEGRDFWLGHSG
jgi:hypothetical protein